jgi:NAD(P)-dependent dehydrogenase (short-subunit alcohol dehydrogenase family)
MLNHQYPIHSKFNARSTSEQVLDTIDLTGKLVVITGGYSGIGLETTKALAKAGATIVVPARRPDIAKEQLASLDRISVAQLDLGDLDSVAEFSNSLLVAGRKIDILINNAGIMTTHEHLTAHGWDLQFAVNHLGHFALVNHLWPLFADGARIVSVSSAGHHLSDIRWDDLHFSRGYDKWQAYGQSKTANILMSVQLDLLGKSKNIHAFSLHPGSILSPLQRHLSIREMVNLGWVDENGNGVDSTFKNPAQGAATTTWAATSRDLDACGGVYCEDCEVAPISDGASLKGVRPYAIDLDSSARLWELSASLTGVNAL